MKILELSTFDEAGGAGRVARRLHEALRLEGQQAVLWSQEVARPAPDVLCPLPAWRRAVRRWLPLLDHLPMLLRHPSREPSHWATGWMTSGVGHQVRNLHPDITHVHWICRGFLGLADIAALPPPVVWTLHDAWAFTGGCHVPDTCRRYEVGCGACPQLGSSAICDMSARTWRAKQRMWSGRSIHVVTPSRWLADGVRASALWRNGPVEVIPNGLDLGTYAPGDRAAARQRLGLPRSALLTGVAAFHATRDRNKGFDLLRDVMAAWTGPACELVVAGEEEGAGPLPWPAHYLGVVRDEVRMADFYRALDVFVLPSRSENFPNVVAEAMACGIPVVAFGIGGIPELVDTARTGILAEAGQPSSLGSALRAVLENRDLAGRLGVAARAHAERELGAPLMARRYLRLYDRILARNRPGGAR